MVSLLLFYAGFDFCEIISAFTKETYIKAILPDVPDSRFGLLLFIVTMNKRSCPFRLNLLQ